MTGWWSRHRLDVIWFAWLAMFAIAETLAIVSKRDGDTLSERTRVWFRTHSRQGRVVFGVGWVVFALWFFWHILWQ